MERMEAVVNLQQQLQSLGYIAERPLAATLLLMSDLGRPLLLEGEAGVGKTDAMDSAFRASAKVLGGCEGEGSGGVPR